MKTIKNKSNEHFVIHLTKEKFIELPVNGSAAVSEEDLTASHIQNLLIRKDIEIVEAQDRETKQIREKKHSSLQKKRAKQKNKR